MTLRLDRSARGRLATSLLALFLALPALAAPAPGPLPLRAARPVVMPPARDIATLPTVAGFPRDPAVPFAADSAASDVFLLGSYGFQDYAGACFSRGWTGEDLTSKVFANVSSAAVANRDIIAAYGPPSTVTLPAPIAGTIMGTPGACGVDADGNLLYLDVLNGPVRVNRALGQYQSFGSFTPEGAWGSAALEPATGRLIVSSPSFTDPARIYAYPPGGGTPTAIAGFGGIHEDTTVAEARLDPFVQLAVDGAGNIYFTDEATPRVRVLRTDGRVVTIAGDGTIGDSGDGGPAQAARFVRPQGIAVSPDGSQLWVADQTANRVRLITNPLSPGATISAYAAAAAPRYLVYSAGRLFAVLNTGLGFAGSVVELFAGGGSAPSLGFSDLYAPPEESAIGRRFNLYDPGAPAPDGTGGYFLSDQPVRVVYHVKADGTVETGAGATYGIHMGHYALRVGTDIATNPAEVSNWVRTEGQGNDWSQRLISPPVDIGPTLDPTLTFDFSLELWGAVEGYVTFNGYNELITVQGEKPDGSWVSLNASLLDPFNGYTVGGPTAPIFSGRGLFRATVHLKGPDNLSLGLASPTRLRWVVQTLPIGTDEDGLGGPTRAAAVIDNIRLVDGASVLLDQDFESGTLGAWTLAAFNGASTPPGVTQYYVRDYPPTNSQVETRSDFDFSDPTCVWQFTSPGDTIPEGIHARLTSPWLARAAADSAVFLTLSGKLPTLTQGRRVTIWARGKNAGDTHPRFNTKGFFELTSGTSGDDLTAPMVLDRLVSFPQDFQPTGLSTPSDSIQFYFQVEDRYEQEISGGPPLATRPRPSRLPFLDDIRVYQSGVDSDGDGIPDARDGCPTENATGQDANGDGCIDPAATLRHVETWEPGAPLRYAVSQTPPAGITDGSTHGAVSAGFSEWIGVGGSSVSVTDQGDTPETIANALDGRNLVTFEDVAFAFPPNIVAVTPTLSFDRQGVFDDRVVPPGMIVDADLMLNPNASFRTATSGPSTGFDVTSVATHEAGHFYGLNHSGVLDATMFFVLQPDTLGRSLTDDDRAAIASAYPSGALATEFGTITGSVTRGATGNPIPGALVTAVRLSGTTPVDSTASDFTRIDGTYALRRLPPGDYAVRITPLDGEVGGIDLTPDDIGPRIAATAETNFQAEWWSDPESDRDDPEVITPLTLTAGSVMPDIHVITNVDTIAPFVTSVSPPADTTDIRIDTSVLVNFSERIDSATLQAAFRLHADGDTSRLGGSGVLFSGGRTFVFTPGAPLAFATPYVLDITTALTDRDGVPLAAPFSTRFTTGPKPPVSITAIQPASAPAGALLTLIGGGFADPPGDNHVLFPCPGCGGDTVSTVLSVTPTSIVTAVPLHAGSGLVRVVAGPDTSNALSFTLLPPVPVATPSAFGDPIALTFAPTDVAVAPDGNTVFAVGDGGLAVVNLDAAKPSYRVPVVQVIGAARSIALTPDGLRAVVTRPSTHDVAIVDANPASGAFGTAVATIPVVADSGASAPDNVAISANGRRAFVDDPGSRVVYELDIDASSATQNQVVAQHPLAAGFPSGALATLPDGSGALFGTVGGGLQQLVVPDSLATLDALDVGGGAAVTPSATRAVMTVGGGLLRTGDLIVIDVPNRIRIAQVTLGGTPRDVAILPQGPAAYVVNSALNRLQVVSLSEASPEYLTRIADVTTGTSPQAVAVGALGTLVAVANHGSHDLSLFRPLDASGNVVTSVIPPVAFPGQQVAVNGNADWMVAGVTVDIGTGAITPDRVFNGTHLAFTVPPVSQMGTNLSATIPSGAPTVPLPFDVVEPLANLSLFASGVVDSQVVPDIVGTRTHTFQHVCVSPDGRLLAVGRYLSGAGASGGYVDVYRISSDAAEPFGARIGRFQVTATGDNIRDMQFTPDGQLLWVGSDLEFTHVIDVRPSSLTFGTVVANPNDLDTMDPITYAVDPMARLMIIGSFVRRNIVFRTFDGLSLDGGPIALPDSPWSSAVSPDGRTLVLGGSNRASFVDLDSRALIATSPAHGATDNTFATRVGSVAVTRDGRRAAGQFAGGMVAVWNLDPAAGPVGQELSFGPALPTGVVTSELVTGSDETSVLAAAGALLYRLDLAGGVPVVTTFPAARPLGLFGVSPDGRQLWSGRPSSDGTTNSGIVEYFDLANAQSIALTAGGGQTGLPGSTLPVLVQLRVAGAGGRALAGVPVECMAPGGSLDGRGPLLRRLTDPRGEVAMQWTLPTGLGPTTMSVHVLGSTAPALAVSATVAPDDASIAPQIVAFGPPDGSTGLSAATPVFVDFNQRMDSVTTAPRVQLFANGLAVPGGFRFLDEGRTVLFTPNALLAFSARCSLSVTAGALDHEGQTLAAGGFSIFTVQAPPTLALASLTPPAVPPGAPVVLNGVGFSAVPAQNTVLVNGALAPVSEATITSLVVNVPIGATTGPVTVAVGAAQSNPLQLVVTTGTGVGGVIGDLAGDPGASRVAMTSDGHRALVTNSLSNTVSVIDLVALATITTVPVGVTPRGVVILPDDSYAYVCNRGSNDVSVIDLRAASPTQYQVVATIPVGLDPIAIAVSGLGPQVLVVNAVSGTLSAIDANPANATFNAVTSNVNTGTGGTAIAITPDGGRAYVVTSTGFMVVIDLSSHAVTANVNTGTGGTAIAITPDGATALVLLSNGTLLAIDIVPGSAKENQVVANVNTGTGGTAIAITPDGGTAYITSADGNEVIVISIAGAIPPSSSSAVPGPAITLTVVATLEVAGAPGGVAVDPSGGGLALVVSQTTGTLTLIGIPTTLPPVAIEFDVNPNALNLRSLGRWVTARLEPPPPWTPQQIDLKSVLLQGVVPVDSSGPASYGDGDGDGIPDVTLRFSRAAVSLVVPEGDRVYVRVAGLLGTTRTFAGIDSIKVQRGKLTAPVAGAQLQSGAPTVVTWESPKNSDVTSVSLLHSTDGGRTWVKDAGGLPNTGLAAWTAPVVATDSARVALVFDLASPDTSAAAVDEGGSAQDVMFGVLAVSDRFRIAGPTDVEPPPLVLSFARIGPNPASGPVGMRYGLPAQARVRLEVFDVAGRRVKSLVDGVRLPGWYTVQWRGDNDASARVGAGLYFVRLRAMGREFRQRLIWMP